MPGWSCKILADRGASPACSQAFTSKTQLDKETGEVFQVLDVDDQGTLDQREPLDLNLALEQEPFWSPLLSDPCYFGMSVSFEFGGCRWR